MNKQEITQNNKIKEICTNNDIRYLGLFGSFAREDYSDTSDVDLLVDFKSTKSLLEKGSVIVEFQNLFNRNIDLVNINSIKPNRKSYIMKDLTTIYEEE